MFDSIKCAVIICFVYVMCVFQRGLIVVKLFFFTYGENVRDAPGYGHGKVHQKEFCSQRRKYSKKKQCTSKQEADRGKIQL